MADLSDLINIGRITRKFSFKGEVVAILDKYHKDFLNLESVLIEQDQNLVPFFIEKIIYTKKNQFRIKFEGFENDFDIQALLKKDIFISENDYPNDLKFMKVEDLIQFKVIDKKLGMLGNIIETSGTNENPLIHINIKEKEVLIPFQDELIENIDNQRKEVLMQIPDGLINFYLEV